MKKKYLHIMGQDLPSPSLGVRSVPKLSPSRQPIQSQNFFLSSKNRCVESKLILDVERLKKRLDNYSNTFLVFNFSNAFDYSIVQVPSAANFSATTQRVPPEKFDTDLRVLTFCRGYKIQNKSFKTRDLLRGPT